MSRRGGVIVAAVLGVTALWAPDAAADTGGVQWKAPAGCPARSWVETRIAKHLGRPMRGEEHADITVETSDAGFRVTVRTRTSGGSGQVSHEHADCSALADLAALIVAMAVDPNASTGAEPAPTPRNTQQRDDESPGSAQFARSATNARALTRSAGPVRQLTLSARGFIAAERGGLPGLAPGMGVAAAATRAPWRLEGSVTYWPARRATLDATPQAGGDVTLFVGALRSCYSVLQLGGPWSLCGLVEVGDIAASSFGVSQPGSGRFVWLALGGAASIAFPLGNSVSFHVDMQSSGNLRRPKFTLPAGLVHQPEPVSFRATSGIEVRFR